MTNNFQIKHQVLVAIVLATYLTAHTNDASYSRHPDDPWYSHVQGSHIAKYSYICLACRPDICN